MSFSDGFPSNLEYFLSRLIDISSEKMLIEDFEQRLPQRYHHPQSNNRLFASEKKTYKIIRQKNTQILV